MASVCKHLLPAWMVVVLGLITKGHGWNLPNSYYQGAGTGGYFGGSGESALGNQAGASSSSWSAGGASGGVDRTGSFGPNQWSSGGGGGGVGAPGVAGGALGGGVGGAGFQQGASAAGSAAGAGVGVAQNPLDNAGGGFGGSTVGPGQYGPHHTNGNGHGGGFGGAFSGQPGGFGTGAHANHGKGSYRPPFAYSVPSSHPWRYGSPASYAGGRWPWYGGGYVYRVPVAHVNPDGSYSFSYYTPYLAREESGDGNGNVAGTYGFQNEGAKHNFSFSAGPDVDLRTGFGGVPPGALDPAQYGSQSVHSRGRLPLVPQTSTQASVDGGQSTVAALPGSVGRPQDATGPNSWAPRAGVDGAGVVRNPTQTAADESELAVVGLPKAGDGATDVSRPASRNQVVRGSTEPTVSTNVNNQLPTTTSGGLFDDRVSLNELDGRGFRSNDASLPGFQSVGADGTGTTARPFGASVDQVQVPRPVNDEQNVAGARFGPGQEDSRDRSYRFGYQTPDATREESADAAGNVRGSFSYNNEAGRNDLQYVAGSGMGFRPTGGSLAVPNGLPGGTAPATGGNFGGRLGGQGDGGFGGASGAFGGSQGGQTGAGGAGGVGGVGSGFGGADGSSFGQGGQVAGGTSGLGGTGSGGGFGGVDGRSFGLGGQTGAGSGGGAGGGFGGADGSSFGQGGQVAGGTGGFGGTGSSGGFGGTDGRSFGLGGQAGTGSFGSGSQGGLDGRSFGAGNQGGNFGASGGSGFGGDGRSFGFGNQGGQPGEGSGGGFGADGRSFGFGNQGGQGGFATGARGAGGGFAGGQGTTHNPVTRSPSLDSLNGSPRSGLNGSGRWNNFNRDAAVSENDDTEASTAVNDEDEQTTTFGGYGDVPGAGFPTNANRRLGQ